MKMRELQDYVRRISNVFADIAMSLTTYIMDTILRWTGPTMLVYFADS